MTDVSRAGVCIAGGAGAFGVTAPVGTEAAEPEGGPVLFDRVQVPAPPCKAGAVELVTVVAKRCVAVVTSVAAESTLGVVGEASTVLVTGAVAALTTDLTDAGLTGGDCGLRDDAVGRAGAVGGAGAETAGTFGTAGG